MDKLVKLPEKGTAVFVGDTHGDYTSTRVVLKNFINKKGHYVVFLGDYVDRGQDSRRNIDFLLDSKEKHDNLVLLAGNHEMFPLRECRPSDFWEGLDAEGFASYKKELMRLPLAAEGPGFIALHGALPDISDVDEINGIKDCSAEWTRIIWGDFRDREGELLGNFLGRPKLGKTYFLRVMNKIGKNVLLRGHDPLAPERMFDNRCLTIFTSSSYMNKKRKIALVRLSDKVKSADDIEIISMDAPDIGEL